ncbi:MAG TPA: hypothetical protein VF610_10790, partial [Segetibacter sp.]
MEFDLRNETNFIKQKFLLYYITSFVLATIIIFSVYKLLPQFTQPEASTVATTLQNEEQKLLSTQDFLYKQYDEIRENSNHTLNTAGSDPQLQRNL